MAVALSKGKKAMIAVAAVAVVAAGTFFWFYTRNKSGLDYANAQTGIMPGIDVDARLRELQELVDKNAIAFSVNTSPLFANGSAQGSLMIENPANNAKLIVAEIYLEGQEECIYNSGALRPGTYIESAKLDQPLPAGEHKATVLFKAYDEETEEFIGQAGAAVTLCIQA